MLGPRFDLTFSEVLKERKSSPNEQSTQRSQIIKSLIRASWVTLVTAFWSYMGKLEPRVGAFSMTAYILHFSKTRINQNVLASPDLEALLLHRNNRPEQQPLPTTTLGSKRNPHNGLPLQSEYLQKAKGLVN